ncbi:protein spaetzle [Megalopta genalis]|uniref:protein spaetzle n=1 Tax=Megalopta genalis TaxID=115081 RepID=UPI003FD048FD
MKEETNMSNALKVLMLLWICIDVHCQMQWYEQSHESYFNYKNLDDKPSVSSSGDSEVRIAPRIGLKWPFSPQNRIKATSQPPSTDDNGVPNDKFLFPGSISNKEQVGPAPVCKETTFCDDVSNYPTKSVSDAIARQNLPHYINVDGIDINFRLAVLTESLCISNEKVVYPKTAETEDNRWLYVVNHPNYTQGVRIETCSLEGESCKLIQGFATGYDTFCAQKYIYRELAAYKDGRITQELFRFPANCCCQVEFVGTSQRLRSNRSYTPLNAENYMGTV